MKAGETVSYDLGGRKAYLVPSEGLIEIDGQSIKSRDGTAIADLDILTVRALEDSELILVDSA